MSIRAVLLVSALTALVCPLTALAAPSTQSASQAPLPTIKPLGSNLQDYAYPYPVSRMTIDTPKGAVQMAYTDVPPRDSRGTAPVIMLLHGKNFSGAYWSDTAAWLSSLGYRVVIPDQIGFGKSDKPADYSYTFAHLADNTHALLEQLDIDKATILGHSMGGMLAVRYALMYPQATHQLVLVDPIGLEDWKARGVPYRGMTAWYAREMNKSYAGIKGYQQASYYHGTWQAAYEPWAVMLAGMYASPGKPQLAYAQALTYDMIYNEPVVYEFGDIQPPTTLMVGSLDRTALGKDLVSPEVRKTLGDYPALAKAAVAAMPHGQLILLDGVGHLPFIEAPARFHTEIKNTLDNIPSHSADADKAPS